MSILEVTSNLCHSNLCHSIMVIFLVDHFIVLSGTGINSLKNPTIFYIILGHAIRGAILVTLLFTIMDGVIQDFLESSV